jgi:glycosyltransferase involved in cell wall biosynthesis
MKIIGIINQRAGSCYHRVYTPLMNMDHDVHITNKLTEEQIEKFGCDLLVYNRYANFNQAKEIEELRLKYGFRIAIDIDDYWHLSENHILKPHWDADGVSNVIINNLIAADIVTCTNERLAEQINTYNKNCHILPNAIPGGFEQFNIKKEKSDKIQIMYQGSITHKDDLDIIKNPMKRVATDSNLVSKIKTTFGGYVHDLPESNMMLSAFTCGLKLNPLVFPAMKPTEYYQVYNHADISIVPLIANKFNSYKSNLKILESAYAGVPVIASRVDPYLDFPEDCVMYVDKQTEWYQHIKLLSKFDYVRELYGRNLMDYCNEHYNFKSINEQRKAIYES